jgi:hypothetical protein
VELELDASPDGCLSYLLSRNGPDGRTFEEKYGLANADAVALICRVLGS